MKIIKKFVLREVADESILIPVGETSKEFNGMITLTSTAAFIWRNLEKAQSLEELANMVADEFECDYEVIMLDLKEFLTKLVLSGIIVADDNAKGW